MKQNYRGTTPTQGCKKLLYYRYIFYFRPICLAKIVKLKKFNQEMHFVCTNRQTQRTTVNATTTNYVQPLH